MRPIDRLKEVARPTIKRLLRPLSRPGIVDADRYVFTDDVSGQPQSEVLKRDGCKPDSKVLEVGCGNLPAGIQPMQYLQRGNYVGVDPNKWLQQTAMKNRRVRQLVKEKQARFLSNDRAL
jgi:hypothetical protein